MCGSICVRPCTLSRAPDGSTIRAEIACELSERFLAGQQIALIESIHNYPPSQCEAVGVKALPKRIYGAIATL